MKKKKIALAALAAALFTFGAARIADAASKTFCSGNQMIRVTTTCWRVEGGRACITTQEVVGSCDRGGTSGPM